MKPLIRDAKLRDLDALLALETQCFDGDRLSRRSFRAFIRDGAHHLFVWEENDRLQGYALLLYRQGTLLARLYSLAVHPDCRGNGIAGQLLDAAEDHARQRNCMFLRLEVREDNHVAITIYEQRGYHHFDRVTDYYEDGAAALRMERRLRGHAAQGIQQAPTYYRQTTEFTCGPASLMMAMHQLDPAQPLDQRQELQLWREATTIFMGRGHGGCSPHGLALAALRRGFYPTLYINDLTTPFLDSVRGEDRRQLLERVHSDFVDQLAAYPATVRQAALDRRQLATLLGRHQHIVALISTWALDRRRQPHWVYLSRNSADTVFINDPDSNTESGQALDDSANDWQSESDYRHVPISLEQFSTMASYGKRRLRCLLAIDRDHS